MEAPPDTTGTAWALLVTEPEWEQTPPAVQAYVHPLRHAMGQLQERVER
jgi:hypothetical protein